MIIFIITFAVGFITFGLKASLCSDAAQIASYPLFDANGTPASYQDVIVNGALYDFDQMAQLLLVKSNGGINLTSDWQVLC